MWRRVKEGALLKVVAFNQEPSRNSIPMNDTALYEFYLNDMVNQTWEGSVRLTGPWWARS
jgi:Neuraminidase (sialidase)